jgi:hypothetical protein
LINRLKRRLAIITNDDARAGLTFRFNFNGDFKVFKKKFMEYFEKVVVNIDEPHKLHFTSDTYPIEIILNQENEIYIEFERFESGIKGLKNKINEFILKLTDFCMNENILGDLIICKIDVILPYYWSYVTINKPKYLNLKKNLIELDDKKFNTQVQIIVDYTKDKKNNMSFKFKDIKAISKIFNKLL